MEEEIQTIEEDVIFAGVSSVNGKTGDVSLKTINGEEVTGEGNIEIEATGTVKSVNEIQPDEEGDVTLTAGDVGAQTPLTAGENITIADGVISATDTTYTAGNGLSLSGTEFSADTTVLATQNDLSGKQNTLSQTQLAAANSGIDSTKVGQIATNTTNIGTNTGDIATINGKIPAQASSSNQLADKSFVNSTVQTASANFRGNWATWNDVPTDANDYPADADGNKTPTKNDYMVVQDASGFPTSPDPALAGTWRFKYSGTWATDGKNGWHPEYQVNETPLTSDQLAALNSGITADAVTKLGGIETGAEVNDIDSISVNGTAVTPDENKNVALTIPEGIKTLTTADYNYPTTGTKTAIALWLLEPGYYRIADDAVWRPQVNDASGTRKGGLVIVGLRSSSTSTYRVPIIAIGNGGAKMTFAGVVDQAGTLVAGLTDPAYAQYGGLLSSLDVQNNLTSTGTSANYLPLSARQGKVLKDLVDAKEDKGTTETLTIADTDWSALSSSNPYTYSATKTLTATIGANSVVELLNDAAIDFATYGFAIGAVNTTNNTVTFYSIGAPSASKTLKVNVKG